MDDVELERILRAAILEFRGYLTAFVLALFSNSLVIYIHLCICMYRYAVCIQTYDACVHVYALSFINKVLLDKTG